MNIVDATHKLAAQVAALDKRVAYIERALQETARVVNAQNGEIQGAIREYRAMITGLSQAVQNHQTVLARAAQGRPPPPAASAQVVRKPQVRQTPPSDMIVETSGRPVETSGFSAPDDDVV